MVTKWSVTSDSLIHHHPQLSTTTTIPSGWWWWWRCVQGRWSRSAGRISIILITQNLTKLASVGLFKFALSSSPVAQIIGMRIEPPAPKQTKPPPPTEQRTMSLRSLSLYLSVTLPAHSLTPIGFRIHLNLLECRVWSGPRKWACAHFHTRIIIVIQ